MFPMKCQKWWVTNVSIEHNFLLIFITSSENDDAYLDVYLTLNILKTRAMPFILVDAYPLRIKRRAVTLGGECKS